MEWLVIWICCGIAAAMVASSKGRSGCGWFVMGFLLGPFGLLFALLSGKEGPTEEERKCPFCAEFIKKEAIICKHCGKNLPKIETEASAQIRNEASLQKCHACGELNRGDADVCRSCGTSLVKG